jgi:hypothetical protein
MLNTKKPATFVFYSSKIEAKSIDDNGKTRYFVKGYVSTGDLDLVNDIVTKSCKDDIHDQFLNRNVKLDYEHETLRKSKGEDDIDMRIGLTKSPLGKRIDALKDSKGNFIEFELNPSWKKYDAKGNVIKTFDEVWNEIKSGFLDAFSIAYVPVRTQSKNINGLIARLLDKINIVNVGLTGNPVNPGASMAEAFTKSLEYLTSEGKMQKKSFDKDGAHAHTENEPLGNHNHPEIEKYIDSLQDTLWDIQSRLASQESQGVKETNIKGEIMTDAVLKSELEVLKKSVDDLTKAVAAMQKKAEDESSKEDDKEDSDEEKKKKEEEMKKKADDEKKKEAEEKAFKEQFALIVKEHAEMKSILEKPQFASKGAEKKENKSEIKSLGPLDLI